MEESKFQIEPNRVPFKMDITYISKTEEGDFELWWITSHFHVNLTIDANSYGWYIAPRSKDDSRYWGSDEDIPYKQGDNIGVKLFRKLQELHAELDKT